MKIALINENSQAAKNGIIEAALKKVVEPMGHEARKRQCKSYADGNDHRYRNEQNLHQGIYPNTVFGYYCDNGSRIERSCKQADR